MLKFILLIIILFQYAGLRQMENQKLLEELENVAARLDIAVRYEDGDFTGGLCRLKSDNVIILNSKHALEKKIAMFARELSTLDLGAIYILPQLRQRISREAAKHENKPAK